MSGNDVQRAIYRSVGASVCGALVTAGLNSFEGYIGGLVLDDHYPEHGYNAHEMSMYGAVGGAIGGAVFGLIINLAKQAGCCQQEGDAEKEQSCYEAIGALVVAAGLAIGNASLGRLILNNLATMNYAQVAAAMGTGVGITTAGLMAVACCCMYVYCCCAAVGVVATDRNNPENAVTVDVDARDNKRPRRHSTRQQRQSAFSAIELPSFSTSAVTLFKGQPAAAANDAKANLEAEKVAEKRAGAALNV